MNLKNDKYTLYKHTSPDGKVYIGITCNPLQRRWKGGHGYSTNAHFYRAIKLYGWSSFQHEVITRNLTETQAIEMERELIAKYDSTNPEKGYNRDPGGGVRSKETAAKISASLTGVPLSIERRQRMSEQRCGRAVSTQTREKISSEHKANLKIQKHILSLNKARAGTPLSEAHRVKIAENQPRRHPVRNLDTGEIFPSIHDAAKSCNGTHGNIVKVCTGKRQTAYGYRWAYEGVNL